jgi:hypothetical protein
MEAPIASYQESADASSIYRDRSGANVAVQNTAAVAGNLAHAMRDAVIVFVSDFCEGGMHYTGDLDDQQKHRAPRGPAQAPVSSYVATSPTPSIT